MSFFSYKQGKMRKRKLPKRKIGREARELWYNVYIKEKMIREEKRG